MTEATKPCPSGDRCGCRAQRGRGGVDRPAAGGRLAGGHVGVPRWQTRTRRNDRNLHCPRVEGGIGIAVTVGAELITVDHAYSHKKLRFVVHLCDWVSGDPQPLAISRCVGCGQMTWGITLFQQPMLGSLRRCLAGWLALPTLREGLMWSDGAWSVVVCLGEALIDRLGPPGGDPAVDRPVDNRLEEHPRMWPVDWLAWAPLWPLPAAGPGRHWRSFFLLFANEVSTLRCCSGMPSVPVASCWSVVRWRSRQFQDFDGDQGGGFADGALESVALPQSVVVIGRCRWRPQCRPRLCCRLCARLRARHCACPRCELASVLGSHS